MHVTRRYNWTRAHLRALSLLFPENPRLVECRADLGRATLQIEILVRTTLQTRPRIASRATIAMGAVLVRAMHPQLLQALALAFAPAQSVVPAWDSAFAMLVRRGWRCRRAADGGRAGAGRAREASEQKVGGGGRERAREGEWWRAGGRAGRQGGPACARPKCSRNQLQVHLNSANFGAQTAKREAESNLDRHRQNLTRHRRVSGCVRPRSPNSPPREWGASHTPSNWVGAAQQPAQSLERGSLDSLTGNGSSQLGFGEHCCFWLQMPASPVWRVSRRSARAQRTDSGPPKSASA